MKEHYDNEILNDILYKEPVYDYLYLLYKSKILTEKEYYYWFDSLTNFIKTIETEVTEEELLLELKSMLRKDITNKELQEHFNNPFFNKENLIKHCKDARVLKNSTYVSNKIKNSFINIFEEIIKEERK